MSPFASIATPPAAPPPPSSPPLQAAVPRAPLVQPRAQYVELKASVHRKMLNRLNLEALAQS
ncbi:MAG TPA: hypothetical protein VG222_07795, partial [Vicinamibacterales bacterium]|nr:hypothetical protein [Vicinamibacterales bacterium]